MALHTTTNHTPKPADRVRVPADNGLEHLAHELENLLEEAQAYEQRFAARIDEAHPNMRESARNLVHYLAIRRFDLRILQESLAKWGLSSLGRTEAHVLESLTAVLKTLRRLTGAGSAAFSPVDFSDSRTRLSTHAVDLFGEPDEGRAVRIMVTLPSEAAGDYRLTHDLIAAGTDVIRINCAHDDEAAWRRMIEHVRQAENESGRKVAILMDLAGAKPRTGMIEPGPEVVKWKPQRNRVGEVVAQARIWLAPEGVRPPEVRDMEGRFASTVDAELPMSEAWLHDVRLGDEIRLRDARGKKRTLQVVERWGSGVIAECDKTAYVCTGTQVELKPGDKRRVAGAIEGIGRLPAADVPIVLKQGDTLLLHAQDTPGRPAIRDSEGVVIAPAHVSCTLPDVIPHLRAGESVKLDDGKIEGIIRAVCSEEIRIEITLASASGSKLRADKGINFPNSDLHAHELTSKDQDDLDFVVRHADAVGLSYAEEPQALASLQRELKERHAEEMGIVLKIETQRGFRDLPRLLLMAMRGYPVGVMIARGDLAVECGWERTAEVQEEILWLCEAAHVPVIWATQVLEGLTKKGIPSRAEITDAAMAERAECVMLNKGPYILKAIRTLDDVLQRMEGHQSKKTSLLRSLKVSELA